MNRAVARAKATHTEFIQALEVVDPAAMGFSIKKPYKAGEGYEHLWVSDVVWDGQVFSGTIGNEPVDMSGVTFGQPVQVMPDELSDWMYIRDGKLFGGYTLRAMMNEYPPAEREAMD